MSSLFGVMVPAGTPKPIVDRLNTELGRILQTPEAQEQLLAQGAYAVSTTPIEAQARLHEEVTRWAKVVKEANVRPD